MIAPAALARADVTALRPLRIPGATYRLQFNRDFTLAAARELLPYLDDLGITDVYASPLLTARPGSLHGYDVVDHSRINPEIGTGEALDELARELRRRGMGLMLDVVPNHMCIADPGNQWWADVLENGPSSAYAPFFDIDWHPPKPDLADKVLLPILGDQYGRILESGELRVEQRDGAFLVRYWDTELPLAPKTWSSLLEPVARRLRADLGEEDRRVLELESILTAIGHLPPRTETDAARVRERQREKEIIKQRLQALTGDGEVAAAVEASLREVNGHRGDPSSFDRLERILAEQAYRLSFWRVATDEINYRRFFDINELAATRVEEPEVFRAVHELSFRLAREGLVTGLRIDHIDGLLDPAGYLDAVQRELAGPGGRPFYLVVEKILVGDERLRPDWATAGTTGYEFLALLNGAFTEPHGLDAIRLAYRRLTGSTESFADLLYGARRLVLQVSMASELTVLARRLDRISEQHRFSRDFTLNTLRHALREIVAAFPVYRTYVRPGDDRVEPGDQQVIERAVEEAVRRNPAMSPSIFRFIGDVLLLRHPEGLDQAQRESRLDFVLRFQQLTAPVMAKGLEDTSFYRYYPLASLNEVGGGPAAVAVPPAAFHAANRERQRTWPYTLAATSTHDTKRGEDVRARLATLSEMPDDWETAVLRWRGLNLPRRLAMADGGEAPDANEEYLLYQTLVGTWPMAGLDLPAYTARIQAYMQKALREAKLHTSWINPNERYERAVAAFIDAVLDPEPGNSFLPDLIGFQARLVRPGLWTSLSQVTLKAAAPGVPDFYQGTELWTFTLVDPDNRQPVDYGRRRALLRELHAEPDQRALARRLAAAPEDDRLKLHITRRALEVRRSSPTLFQEGSYHPLAPEGPRGRHLLAFGRARGAESCLALAGRFYLGLGAERETPAGGLWRGTAVLLPEELGRGPWRNAFTGETVAARTDRTLALDTVFADLPVALLHTI